MNKRKFVFYTNWVAHDLYCACLFHNPMCSHYRECEELELTLHPYEDIETVMKDQRRYKKEHGVTKQI